MIFLYENNGKIFSELSSKAVWIVTRIKFRRICKNFLKKVGRKPNFKERQKIWKLFFEQGFVNWG